MFLASLVLRENLVNLDTVPLDSPEKRVSLASLVSLVVKVPLDPLVLMVLLDSLD